MVSATIRERYLRDPWPIRLGGLAADLARVASFADDPRDHTAVADLLEEGKYFAEWSAPDAPVEIQASLAEVQRDLAMWRLRWLAGRPVPSMREAAQRWSDELLKLAGFV
ncbi:MAG: hypothetical protein HY597_05990 [Candidatus Omnitrophica bacterium]|nr:hypothetical protein [Candidatus Omnitrophota bacterium]